jgi:hypothetical protein
VEAYVTIPETSTLAENSPIDFTFMTTVEGSIITHLTKKTVNLVVKLADEIKTQEIDNEIKVLI